VRYVGDPVAVVLAETEEAARDAADVVAIDYEPLPAVVIMDDALAEGSTLLYPEWGTNVLARSRIEQGDVDQAFAGADVTVADRFHVGRVGCVPLEARGVIASHDPLTDQITLVTSTQSPHHVRTDLAACLGRAEGSIRVIPPDVGGSFGCKDHACAPEAILCALAQHVGRPIRWIEQRGEHLAATGHSREQVLDVELAADSSGRLLGLRGRLLFDVGAASTTHGMGIAIYAGSVLPGPYRLDNYRLEMLGVVTNKGPSGAYRGYGAPEAAFVIEGLMDRLARRLNLDPADLRRRNLITPEQMPYRTVSGCSYDSADVPGLLDRALVTSRYTDHRSLYPAHAKRTGEFRDGIGIACCVLMGGFGPSGASAMAGLHYGGFETATVRMDGDGRALVLTGLPSQGQGLDTALAQVCAAVLGIDAAADVDVIAGDTAVTPYSPVGPVASRGAAVGGSAVHRAAGHVAGSLKHAAAIKLETAPEDVELANGRAFVHGAPDRSMRIVELAAEVKMGRFVDQGVDPSLEAVATFDPPDKTYSFAVHVATVRVDTSTGAVRVLRYVTASDCGMLINPAIVRGQIRGGVVQGIGGALLEELAYGAEGDFLSGSLMQYLIPSAAESPAIEVVLTETPTDRSATGARGVGELGIIGPGAAVANAIADALGGEYPHPNRTPLTPHRVWTIAHSAGVERAG
jgi:carbon-monoxide dehydrogenase large subunit